MKTQLLKTLFFSLLLAFSLSSCEKEFEPGGLNELNYDLALPIGYAQLTLGDLIPSDNENIIVNSDNTIKFYFRQDSLFYFSIADLIEIPAQEAEIETFKLGEITLENFGPISSDITMEELIDQIDTNTANFISSLDGTTSNLPALAAGSPQSHGFSAFDDFEYVTFSSGGLVFSVVNNLAIDFQSMDFTIYTIDGTDTINLGGFQISDLEAGGWKSDTIYLEGKTLHNSFAASLNDFTTYATSAPVPVDLADQILLGISSYDLKVISGKARLPQQELEGLNEIVDFGVSEGERITTLKMSTARINYQVQTNFDISFDFLLKFPTADQNGSPVAFSINSMTNPTGYFDLAGVEFDFASISSQPYNQLPVSIEFAMDNASQWVEFDSSSAITFTYSFDNIALDYVEGWVGNKTIDLARDTIPFEIEQLMNLSGTMEFANPEISLLIKSNIGIPIGLDLGLINHGISGTEVDLGLDLLNLPVPASHGTYVEEKVKINNSNSNLSAFLATIPNQLYVSGSALTNPASSASNPDYSNFVSSDGELNLGIEIELPFDLKIQNLTFSDTIGVNISRDQVEDFESGSISLLTLNGLPFDIDLNLIFFDSITNLVYDTIAIDMLDPAIVNTDGVVTEAAEKHFEFSLTKDEFLDLSNSNKVIIQANINTSNGGTQHVVFIQTMPWM
jgi:hypothetical protein